MDVQELVGGMRDAMTVKRVFGDPYERDGVTVIPVASFGGGGGAGGGQGVDGDGGSGGGFGLGAKPAGVYVIRDGVVSWQPALDVNQIVKRGSAVFIASLLVWRSVVRTRARVRREREAFRAKTARRKAR